MDASLTEEVIWKLRENVEDYRRKTDRLDYQNRKLSRDNYRLKRLCSSIGSLWDVLNEDVEALVSSACLVPDPNPSVCATNLIDTLLETMLPLSVKEGNNDDGDDSRCLVVGTDDFTNGPDAKGGSQNDTEGTDDNYDEVLKQHMESFNKKKTTLLTHVKHLEESLREHSKGRYPMEATQDVHEELATERLKNRVLQLSTRLLCDSVSEMRDEVNKKIKKCHTLEIETSRLSKVNAELRYRLNLAQTELTAKQTQESESAKQEETKGASHIEPADENQGTSKVEKVEDITKEMIIGSAVYARIFDHAKKLDDELGRLERENASLRSIVENGNQDEDKKTIQFFNTHEDLYSKMIKRIEDCEQNIVPLKAEIIKMREREEELQSLLKGINEERDRIMEELKKRDQKLQEVSQTSAKISKAFGDSHSGGHKAAVPIDYQEQIQNLAQELDEISGAFEEKIVFTEGLMQQVKEARQYREKCSTLEVTVRTLQDKMTRMTTVYDNRAGTMQKQIEKSENRADVYRKNWVECFKRASHYEKQRNTSMSALCESQSLYRRCFREKKELLNHIMQLKSQGTLTALGSVSVEATVEPGSGLFNVMQENDVLRRRMTCTVCSEDFRDHCITICGHVFCKACISDNIKSRNRKCPVCKVTFDKRDVQRLFLD